MPLLTALICNKMSQEKEIIVGDSMEIIILDEIIVMPVLGFF